MHKNNFYGSNCYTDPPTLGLLLWPKQMIILRLQKTAAPVRVSIGVNFLIPIISPKDGRAGIAEEDSIARMDGFVEKTASTAEKNRN